MNLAPAIPPLTAREVSSLLFGESHAVHSVASVDNRTRSIALTCSCSTSWVVDRVMCTGAGTKFGAVRNALRNAPLAG